MSTEPLPSADSSLQGAILALAARDIITPVPLEHWDVDLLAQAAAGAALPARFGCFLTGTDQFDVFLFGLSGGEAELMDAQQRLLLEVSLEALRHAGISVAHPSSTAVAVGIASAEYNNYLVPRHTSGVSAYSATGGALSVASGRLRCGVVQCAAVEEGHPVWGSLHLK